MNTDPDIKVFLNFSAGAMNVNGIAQNWEAEFVEEIENLKIESLKTSFRRGFTKGRSSGTGQVEGTKRHSARSWPNHSRRPHEE